MTVLLNAWNWRQLDATTPLPVLIRSLNLSMKRLEGMNTFTRPITIQPKVGVGITVVSGGATVTAGGITVTAGGVTINGGLLSVTPSAAVGPSLINCAGTVSGGIIRFAMSFQPIFDSTVTTLGVGFWINCSTTASAFTMATWQGIRLSNPTLGAGSAITTAIGLWIDNITVGGTNFAIQTVGGGIQFAGLAAFVAGDHYVVVDASGNLHKSALGPAS